MSAYNTRMHPFTSLGSHDALCHLGLAKTGATRQVEIMRELAKAGKIPELTAMANQLRGAGALKMSGPGTSLKRLGTGAEAIADLVVGAKASPEALAARKTYDKLGPLYSEEGLSDKINTLRRLRAQGPSKDVYDNPEFTKLYGGLGKGESGGRYAINEFLPKMRAGKPLPTEVSAAQNAARDPAAKAEQMQKALGRPVATAEPMMARQAKQAPIYEEFRNRGLSDMDAMAKAEKMIPSQGGSMLGDLHGENMVGVPGGAHKVLDFFTTPSHRVGDSGTAIQQLNEMAYSQAGQLGHTSVSPERQRQLMGRVWEAEVGHHVSPSAIGMGPFGPAGLTTGPKSGKGLDAVMSGLGPGSRQAPKLREGALTSLPIAPPAAP